MLSSWRIKNFKAWQDTGAIKLAPLTVFFGENSVGKSSLGQLLQALKQSATATAQPQPLDFGNAQSLIDLGSFTQNLHQGQLDQPLEFELQWRLASELALQGLGQHETVRVDELRLQVSVIADQAQQPVVQSICYSAYQQTQEQCRVSYCSTKNTELQVQIYQSQAQSFNIALADAVSPERFYQFPIAQHVDAQFINALALQTQSVLAGVHALAALRAAPQRCYSWSGEAPVSVGRSGESVVAALLAANAQQRQLQFAADQSELPFAQGIAYWLKQIGVARIGRASWGERG